MSLILLFALFFVPVACGKKGPPFLPKVEFSLGVKKLSAELKKGGVYLQGNIIGPQDETIDSSTISGCKVFYAFFPVDNPPCEGCPIKFRLLKEIEGKVTIDGRFFCEVLEKKMTGIYFFKVRLTGKNGGIGPHSNRAKLVL